MNEFNIISDDQTRDRRKLCKSAGDTIGMLSRISKRFSTYPLVAMLPAVLALPQPCHAHDASPLFYTGGYLISLIITLIIAVPGTRVFWTIVHIILFIIGFNVMLTSRSREISNFTIYWPWLLLLLSCSFSLLFRYLKKKKEH